MHAIQKRLKSNPDAIHLDHGQIFIGFSDATCLGLWLHAQRLTNPASRVNFLHGPMYYATETAKASGVSLGSGTSLNDITAILRKPPKTLTYSLKQVNDVPFDVIDLTSILGGNTSLIQRNFHVLLREISWDGVTLFLEDTTEDPKRLLDILRGMFDSGVFDGVKAIFFGNQPLSCGTLEEFFNDFDAYLAVRFEHRVPMFHSTDFGHGVTNSPIPMGTPTTFTREEDGTVTAKISWFTSPSQSVT